MTTAELLALEGSEQEDWVVQGVLPTGLALVVAPPKSGKSRFCIQVAGAVANGLPCFDYLQTKKGHVAYYSLEPGTATMRSAIKTLGVPPESDIDWCFALPGNGAHADFLHDVRQRAKERPDMRLVIVDMYASLPASHEAQKESNFYNVTQKQLQPLHNLAKSLNVALVLVHHMNAEGGVGGGAAMEGTPDVILRLSRKPLAAIGQLTVDGRSVQQQSFDLHWARETGKWTHPRANTQAAPAGATNRKRIEAAVDGIVGTQALDKATIYERAQTMLSSDKSTSISDSYLRRMVDECLKKRTDDGTFHRERTKPVLFSRIG